MPIPHRVQKQMIQRRLVGKEGGERIKELREILTELPDYKNGPYADLRKWVNGQIDAARVRKKAVHRDSIAVRREGGPVAFPASADVPRSPPVQWSLVV